MKMDRISTRMLMNPDHPFEELMHQINDMLQFVADNADKPLKEPLPKDIEAKIGNLERQVAAFRKANRAHIAQMGISDEDMDACLKQTPSATIQSLNKIQERTEKLTQEIEKKKAILEGRHEKTSSAPPENISISEEKDLSKSPTTRKNLFKRVGGKKNWRPL